MTGRRLGLRSVALGYLLLVLLGPLSMVFWRTFEHGFGQAWAALSSSETLHAFKITLIITAIAVPANTIFGIACALAIVRRKFPGKGIVNAFVDLLVELNWNGGKIQRPPGADHGFRQPADFTIRHSREVDCHQERRNLVVGDLAACVAFDKIQDLFGIEFLGVALPLNQINCSHGNKTPRLTS